MSHTNERSSEETSGKAARPELAEGLIKQLTEAFETAAKPLADEKLQLALMEQFAAAGEQVIKLDFSGLTEALKLGAGGKAMTEDDIRRLLAEAETKKAEDAKKLAATREAKVKLFTDALDQAEGLKSLAETARKELAKAAELITAEMSDGPDRDGDMPDSKSLPLCR